MKRNPVLAITMRIAIVQRMGVFIHGLPRWIALVLLEQKARGAVLEQNVRRFPQYVEWHMPDQAEWETLFEAVGGKSTAAKELRSATGWNNAGEDRFAFSALPAGSRELENSESADGNSVYLPGEFSGKGYVACFWSSTETLTESEYTETAYRIYWENKDDNVGIGNRMKSLMMGVRCVKD